MDTVHNEAEVIAQTEIDSPARRPLAMLLLAADRFPPFRVDVDVLFGQELVRRGHALDWILQSEGDCERAHHTRWSGCDVWVGTTDNGTTVLARLRKHMRGLRHDLRVFSRVRKKQYDIVQVKDKFIAGLFGLLAAKIGGARFTYWLSYPFPESSLYKAGQSTGPYRVFYYLRGQVFKFLLYRMILPKADHVFAQSEQMKRDLIAMGVAPEKLSPVPMGVTLESFPRTPPGARPPANREPRVVYLGTLVKIRRMDFLVRAMFYVLREIPNARLWFVGSGEDVSDEQLLRDEAHRLGIEKQVVFTGFLPRDQALGHVLEADVCVSPFHPSPVLNSASPTKLIEYMAMGKAVVANDHPEQRMVIEESGAGLCVPYEEEAFARAIVRLLRDPGEAERMGERGREYVERHRTYTHIADAVEREYLKLCGVDS